MRLIQESYRITPQGESEKSIFMTLLEMQYVNLYPAKDLTTPPCIKTSEEDQCELPVIEESAKPVS